MYNLILFQVRRLCAYLILNYSLDQEEKENPKESAKEASEKHLF